MSTLDFITELFCRVDDAMHDVSKHAQANVYPSEVVTLAMLFSLKGVGNRPFYRWAHRDLLALFPHMPERTRLFRLFSAHREWTERFMAEPTVMGVADSFGIELLHPRRKGRSPNQIARFGRSNHVWILGGKICVVLNKWGLVCGWDCATANTYDTYFHPLIREFDERMVVVADHGFYSAKGTPGYGKRARKEWAEPNSANPPNLLIKRHNHWNSRMLIETVFSMLTRVCNFKSMGHRVWSYFQSHLAYAMALFNVLVQWNGLTPDEEGFVHLSIAHFSL